ncbi:MULTISPECIES: nuclease-related domain-containing DEAD/DEAH box helicase [Shewanella]|uniref:DUF2075 domain-containing protein n=1 Tax=Shewanella marisflavi TaxID=260364 RepID=A0ABX5WMF0_9GAMM|nr:MULTISPECIES: NERD domain-containing protein/DEAD/DEAH box helicase [Shewanella]QDF75261.1 DUF2075 domain-containing protein [Shewanella marisflavi]
MQINPSKPYENRSQAELKVFDAFRKLVMDSGFVFHSVGLPMHGENQTREIDFLLICAAGIFAFEVKGGGVYREDGNWFSRGKSEKFIIKNPKRQARSAIYELRDSLINMGLLSYEHVIGFGIIIPETGEFQSSLELPKELVCTRKEFRHFRAWIDEHIAYWQGESEKIKQLDYSDIKAISKALRPDFIPKLCDKPFEGLSEEQSNVVRDFLDHKNIICEGPAGTGKTLLIKKLANEYLHYSKKLLIICHSKWLKAYLQSELQNERVIVAYPGSVEIVSRRNLINGYDYVIIDEAQICLNKKLVTLLNRYLYGGLGTGHWLLFQDSINQIENNYPNCIESINYIKSLPHSNHSLTKSFRNTRTLLSYLKKKIGTASLKTDSMNGPSVQEYMIDPDDVQGSLSKIILHQMSSGYKSSEITVLSPREYNDSVINRLPKKILNQVVQLDDYKMKDFPPREISFSTIDNFQGLENKCIVLIDVSHELFDSEQKVAYVGMTRASEQLCIVSNDIDFVINTDLEDDPGWQVILENTFLVNEAEGFREQSLLVPKLGFELVHEQRVVAMAEFAWPDYKIAVFEPEELDAKEAFSQLGWKCYFAPIDATALQEISLSVNEPSSN